MTWKNSKSGTPESKATNKIENDNGARMYGVWYVVVTCPNRVIFVD